MPTFNPPLGRETTVPVASTDRERYVHLCFTLTFDAGEDPAGSWELWTDIADVHSNGQEGGWRAVQFRAAEPAKDAQQDEHSQITPLLSLPSTPNLSAAPPATLTLVAEMVVPAHPATYAYTHRHVTESGETRWLGNGGDNGVVRVIEGEAVTSPVEPKEWTGIAVEMPEDGAAPIVHVIPNEEKTNASIVLLRSIPPAVRPLFHIADSAQAGAGEPRSSLVVTSESLRPIPIEAKSTNAVSSGIKYLVDDKRALADLLQEGCRGQTNIQPAIGALADEAVILLYCPTERPTTSYLIIYVPDRQQARTFKPLLPTLQSDKAPLALRIGTSDAGHSFIPADRISEALLGLSAGKTACIVEINQFINLPTKAGSSIWIASPDALTAEVKEDTVVSEADEDDEDESEPSTEMSKSVSTISQSESESSSVNSETSVRRKVEPSTFLHFLRRFFFSIWSWIFAPFGFGHKHQTRSASIADVNEESIVSTPGAQTPKETTPLLGSPEASQSTSSTAASPYVTPNMAKSLSAASSAPTSSQPAQIRSYASFTFGRAPFHLLFAPGVASQVLSELSIRYRKQPDGPWAVSKAVPSAGDNGQCDELVFGKECEDDHARWEVEVETF